MSITKKIELEPFRVPNFVIAKAKPGLKQDGFVNAAPTFHISELDDETLKMLCNQFCVDVFAKARTKPTKDQS